MIRHLWFCRVAVAMAVFSIPIGLNAAPPDLQVTARFPDESTGTMHYAEALTLTIGDAKPLVIERSLEDPLLAIPGPKFRLAESRFLLLGWSSAGSGMQFMHGWLVSVQNSAVVLERQMLVMTDRPSAGLLVRTGRRSTLIGFPEPPAGFVHNDDEWFLSLGRSDDDFVDLEQMRNLTFERIEPQKTDLFFDPPMKTHPFPKRVAWIEITAGGFRFAPASQVERLTGCRLTGCKSEERGAQSEPPILATCNLQPSLRTYTLQTQTHNRQRQPLTSEGRRLWLLSLSRSSPP